MGSVQSTRSWLAAEICTLAILLSLEAGNAWGVQTRPTLEMQLDLAQHVVCGELVWLDEVEGTSRSANQLVRATVAITETMKGEANSRITFLLRLKTSYSKPKGEITHSPQLGDVGIWLIQADGFMDEEYGLLPRKSKSHVQDLLEELKSREWTPPVAGVQVWTKVTAEDAAQGPTILLAVRNCSDQEIYFPTARTKEFVHLTVTDDAGLETKHLFSRYSARQDVPCQKLLPGEIRYVHPFDDVILVSEFGTALAAGSYTVVFTCQNENQDGKALIAGEETSVTAWCGTLKTSPMELIVPEDERKMKYRRAALDIQRK